MAKVMDEMGIRGIAGETVMEKDSCDSKNADKGHRAWNRTDRGVQRSPARFRSAITPHGTTTCSPETLKRAYEEEDVKAGTVFTLHVAEMDYEMTQLREQYNMTPIEFMEHIGVLGRIHWRPTASAQRNMTWRSSRSMARPWPTASPPTRRPQRA